MSRVVLFVCTANICRSPMAEAILNAHAQKSNDKWRARSAGTWANENQAAASLAVQALAERGLALTGHRAHQVTLEDLARADVVLVMTRNHRDALVSEFPTQRNKIHLMSELEARQYDIGDPYGGEIEEYRLRAQELDSLIERGYERIKQWTPAETD